MDDKKRKITAVVAIILIVAMVGGMVVAGLASAF